MFLFIQGGSKPDKIHRWGRKRIAHRSGSIGQRASTPTLSLPLSFSLSLSVFLSPALSITSRTCSLRFSYPILSPLCGKLETHDARQRNASLRFFRDPPVGDHRTTTLESLRHVYFLYYTRRHKRPRKKRGAQRTHADTGGHEKTITGKHMTRFTRFPIHGRRARSTTRYESRGGEEG